MSAKRVRRGPAGRRRKRKTGKGFGFGTLLFLAAVATTVYWYRSSLWGNSLSVFTITGGNLPVTSSSGGPADKHSLLEYLVTFLNAGDEVRILERSGNETLVLVVKHNAYPTQVKGWVPTELIRKYARPKRSLEQR